MASEIIYNGPGDEFYDIDEFQRVLEHHFPATKVERYEYFGGESDPHFLTGKSLKFGLNGGSLIAGYYVAKHLDEGEGSKVVTWAMGPEKDALRLAMDKIRAHQIVDDICISWEKQSTDSYRCPF